MLTMAKKKTKRAAGKLDGPGKPPKALDTSSLSGRVGAEIRRRRLAKGLTAAKAAEAAEAAATAWYAWEHGTGLSVDNLARIAAVLGCKTRASCRTTFEFPTCRLGRINFFTFYPETKR